MATTSASTAVAAVEPVFTQSGRLALFRTEKLDLGRRC
jgi:hypothetical protein